MWQYITHNMLQSTRLPPGEQVLASAFQDYPIWAYIQPREGLRVKLLKWVLKRYMRGILAKSKLRQGCVYAVRDGPGDSLAGVILLWRPSTAGEADLLCPIPRSGASDESSGPPPGSCAGEHAECSHQRPCVLLYVAQLSEHQTCMAWQALGAWSCPHGRWSGRGCWRCPSALAQLSHTACCR